MSSQSHNASNFLRLPLRWAAVLVTVPLLGLTAPQTGFAQTNLSKAIQADDSEKVASILKLNAQDKNKLMPRFGVVPLQMAIQSKSLKTTKYLLDIGANVDQSRQKESLLHHAIRSQSSEIFDLILARTDNVNIKNTNQQTPLMLLVTYRLGQKLDAIDKLVKKGCDLDQVNRNKQTALHMACYYNRPLVAKKLISAGAKIGAVDNNNQTPLMAACVSCHDVVQDLLDAGADSSIVNRNNQTVLHLLCQRRTRGPEKDRPYIDTILRNIKEVDVEDKYGQTPLRMAVYSQSLEMTKKLLARGADPNHVATNSKIRRPLPPLLTVAAGARSSQMAEALIAGGADINAKDSQGNTSLHTAVSAGVNMLSSVRRGGMGGPRRGPQSGMPTSVSQAKSSYELIIEKLLDSKADSNLRNKRGQTPIQLAIEGDFHAAVELLVDLADESSFKIKDGTMLHWAATHGLHKTAKRVYAKLAPPVDKKNNSGKTALHLAAENGRLEVADFLLKQNASVDLKDSDGMSALLLAATSKNAKLLDLLFRNGANPLQTDESGQLALHLAAWSGDVPSAKTIMGFIPTGPPGSKTKVHATKSGYTPMHAAACQGNAQMIEYLAQQNQGINAVDSDGWSPLHKAVYRGQLESAKCLLKFGANKELKNGVGMTALQLAPKDNQAIRDLLK